MVSLLAARGIALGELVRQKLAVAEGGPISAADAGRMLGVSKATVLRRWHHHRLIGWNHGRLVRIPLWQFAGRKMVRGIEEILRIFGSDDQWRVMRYFLGNRLSLAHRRPIDLLREGMTVEVVSHAKAHAEENTW